MTHGFSRSIGSQNVTRLEEDDQRNVRLKPGDSILGRYTVKEELGQGGMGIVYRCHDTIGKVDVAIKGLPPEVSHSDSEMEGILENYQLVRVLRHPNIAGVTSLEQDTATRDYYLVMDIAAGESLEQWRRRNRDAGMAAKLAILRQVAEALDYAHGAGVMHRDIKPENIMIDADGHVSVLDFGLAERIRTSLSRVSMAVTSRSGTPGYKSPEQWRAQPQGAAADMYSLGVVAYVLLSGRLPFDSSETEILRLAVLNDPMPPVRGVPSGVNVALRRALAKKPEDRFKSCVEFVNALAGKKSAGRNSPSKEDDGSAGRVGTAAKALLAFALLAALAGGVYFGWIRRDEGRRDEGRRDYAVEAATAKPAKENVGAAKPVKVKEYIRDTKPVDEDVKVAKPVKEVVKASMPVKEDVKASMPVKEDISDAMPVKEESGNAKDVAEPTKPEQKPEIPEQDRTSSGKTEIETPDELEQLLSADKTDKFFEAYNNNRYEEAGRLINSINLENVTVQFCLGWMYANGYGVKKDEAEAVKWYRKAADQNDADAQRNLGIMYDKGEGVKQDKVEAAKWFRKAAEQNDANAQLNLGYIYANGIGGVDKNLAEAVKWYRKAAEQDYKYAQFVLGQSYENGWGIKKDEVEAAKWYHKAAEQNYAAAQRNLGSMYEDGRGVKKNEAEAVKWYRKAAEQNDAAAQRDLGSMYKDGRGVKKDEAEALKWYRKAAEQNDANAQLNVGYMYLYGHGVEKDENEALKWYRKAAEQNYVYAQSTLGLCYENGWGIKKNEAEAVKWYRKAAEQNYAAAQRNLGSMYEDGRGVKKDEAEALKWYRKAAEQGDEDAKKALKRLNEASDIKSEPQTTSDAPPTNAATVTETTTYVVQPGDTLSTLSKRTRIKIDAIKKANPQIKGDYLIVGQKLTIPGKVKIEPPKAVVPPATPQPYTGPTKTYVVKAGDTLPDIARAHKISITQLKAMNNMKSDVSVVGRKLTVPDPAAAAK